MQGRTGEETEHESQVKRPDILVDGRVVSGIDRKIRERTIRQNRIQKRLEDMTRKPQEQSLERRSCT